MAKRKILIVEDDAALAGELERRLVALGYEVPAIAASGSAATALIAEAAPDLMLIDAALPGAVNGVAVAEEIRRRASFPIVQMFAAADTSVARPREEERRAYVVHPFSDRELRTHIELAIHEYRAARAAPQLESGFFAVAVDLLCYLDFDGHFKSLNPAWERALGFTREELMAKPFIEFVHPDDRQRTLDQNHAVRLGGQALSFENRYRCKDGSYRWLRWNATPDPANRVIYSTARDVTDSKAANDERERLVVELQTALAEVRQLRAIIPICSYCRKIRDDGDYWHTVENYISKHTLSRFSHSICPTCMTDVVEPQIQELEEA